VTCVACFEHLQAAPFTPWIDVLRSVLELARDDPRERRTETVQAFLEGHLADLAEFGALLNPLLDLSLPLSQVVESLDAQTRRQKLFELIARILVAAADGRGHVILLEDLHWMMIPVGGHFTIDANAAAQVVKSFAPKIVIPMHYKTEKVDFPITPVENFTKLMDTVEQAGSSEIVVTKQSLPAKLKVVVLEAAN